MIDETDEPVDVEVEIEPGTVDGESVDAWRPDFPLPSPALERIDSRRWLVLPERYAFKPLSALEAARECDKLTSSPGGAAFVRVALALRSRRELELSGLREEYDLETAEQLCDLAMVDHANEAISELLEALEGKGRGLTELSLGWLLKCNVRRVPLPGSTDTGGPVHNEKGPAGWPDFYRGRYVILHRLAAAVAWETLAPFFCDLRPRPAAGA